MCRNLMSIFMIFLLFFQHIPLLSAHNDANDVNLLKHLSAFQVNPDNSLEDKADKIFKMCLILDEFAVKELYFKNLKEEAELLLTMIRTGYMQVLEYVPHHPRAQLFADAHGVVNSFNVLGQGDPNAMKAVSGLYDDDEDDVPDDLYMKAFWAARSMLASDTSLEAKELTEIQKKASFLSFTAKEFSSLIACTGAGLTAGTALGISIVQSTQIDYLLYVCMAGGAIGGWLSWLAGSGLYKNCYLPLKKKIAKRKARQDVQDLDKTAQDDLLRQMEEGTLETLGHKSNTSRKASFNPEIIPGIGDYDSLSDKKKQKLKNCYLQHLYASPKTKADNEYITRYLALTQEYRINLTEEKPEKQTNTSSSNQGSHLARLWGRIRGESKAKTTPLESEKEKTDRPDIELVVVETEQDLDEVIIHRDESNEKKAEKMFQILLLLDAFAIKKLYFKGHIEQSDKLIHMLSLGYQMVMEYDPTHPHAHFFYEARRHLGDAGNVIEGDKVSQTIISGLYADDNNDDVKDDVECQQYWLAKAAEDENSPKPGVSKEEKEKKASWIEFTGRELTGFIAAETAGAITGYGIGQALQEALEYNWLLYIGIGAGLGIGALSWFGGLKLYDIVIACKDCYAKRKALQNLDNAFDENNDQAEIIDMQPAQSLKNKPPKIRLEALEGDSKAGNLDLVEIDDGAVEEDSQTISSDHSAMKSQGSTRYESLPKEERNKLKEEYLQALFTRGPKDPVVEKYLKLTKERRQKKAKIELEKRSRDFESNQGVLKRTSRRLKSLLGRKSDEPEHYAQFCSSSSSSSAGANPKSKIESKEAKVLLGIKIAQNILSAFGFTLNEPEEELDMNELTQNDDLLEYINNMMVDISKLGFQNNPEGYVEHLYQNQAELEEVLRRSQLILELIGYRVILEQESGLIETHSSSGETMLEMQESV